ETPEPVSLSCKPSVKSSGLLRRTEYFQLPGAEKLRMIASQAGTSLSRIITAVAAAYLNRMTSAYEVTLGLAVSARLDTVSRNIPMRLSNVLPLRLMVLPSMSISELLQQVARKIQQGLRHQRYRSEELSRELGLGATNRKLFGPIVNF